MTERKQGFVFEPFSGQYLPVEPCPFCGGLDIEGYADQLSGGEVLRCLNCGAQGPNSYYRIDRGIVRWNSWPRNRAAMPAREDLAVAWANFKREVMAAIAEDWRRIKRLFWRREPRI